MLAGAGDGDGDVEVGRDGLAGQPHLVIRRHPAGVDGGAGCAHGAAQQVRQLLQLGERLRAAQTAPAGHHNARILQFDALGILFNGVHDAGAGGGRVDFHRESDDLPGTAGVGVQRLVSLGADGGNLRSAVATDHGDGAAAVHRAVGQQAAGAGVRRHFQAVLRQADAQPERQAGRQFPALVVAGNQDDAGIDLAGNRLHRQQVQVGVVVGQGRVGDGVGGVGPAGDGLLGRGADVSAQQCNGQGLAESVGQRAAGGEQFRPGGAELASADGVKNEDSGGVWHFGGLREVGASNSPAFRHLNNRHSGASRNLWLPVPLR